MELTIFEGVKLMEVENQVYASRKDLQVMYGVEKKNLEYHINNLKRDGLIIGKDFFPNSGRAYEIYDLDEIVSIGFRLRSKTAIRFQKWSRSVISGQLQAQLNEYRGQLMLEQQKNRINQKQLDYFWDKEDQNDLYNSKK
jgi:hypothetical protein